MKKSEAKRNIPKVCLECTLIFDDGKKLSHHLMKIHSMSSESYTVKHFYDGVRPTCPVCAIKTRQLGYEFKKFCKNHSKEAESQGGKIGGKIKQTWNKSKTKETDARLFLQSAKLKGENNPFYGKKHTEESRYKMSNSLKITEEQFEVKITNRQDVIVHTQYIDYKTRQGQYLTVECIACHEIFKKTLENLDKQSKCPKCFPTTISTQQREIADVISSWGFETILSNRELISPKEIDILVPVKKLAIEYHGLYWHSLDDFDKNKHSTKRMLCESVGLTLVQLFSDDWRDKRIICESILRHRLGISTHRVMARNCDVKQITNAESAEFFDKCHMSGKTTSTISFGLFNDGDLVAAVSLRKPRQVKYADQKLIEIARFAVELDTHVAGGFSKVLKKAITWSKDNLFDGIITYADLLTGTGKVYSTCGFEHIGNTGVNYWYTDGIDRFDRFKFRATPTKTEQQVASEANVKKIYGAGSEIFIKKFA